MRKTLFRIQSVLLFICTLCFLKTVAQPPRAWAAQIPNVNVLAMDVDKKGAVYIIGNFVGTVDFDPGAGTAVATTSSSSEFFLLKLSHSGTFVWAKQFNTNDQGMFYGKALRCDGDSGLYISGFFKGICDFNPGPGVFSMSAPIPEGDGFVFKLDTSGDFRWAREFNGDVNVQEIALGETDNLYLTGEYVGTADFDPDTNNTFLLTTPFSSSTNAFILKLTREGNFKWVKTLIGQDQSGGQGLSVACDTTSKKCCFVGIAGTGTDLDPGPGQYMSSTRCSFICELDTGGNTLQSKSINGTSWLTSVLYDSGFLLGGYFTYIIDVDPGPAVQNRYCPQNTWEGLLLKLTDSLTLDWAKEIDGSSYSAITGSKIAIDKNKHIFLFAKFTGSFDLDPSQGIQTLTSNTLAPPATPYDYLVAEYDSLCNLIWSSNIGPCWHRIAPGHTTFGGDIYLTNLFSGTIDVDPGPSSYTLTSSSPRSIFIERLSTCTGSAVPQLSVNASALAVCAGQQLVLNASGAVSYQWAHGPAQSAVGISPTVSTWYEVMGTDSAGCSGFKNVQIPVNNCTGLNEFINSEKIIYPNPTTNRIMVPALPGSKISVCDLSGKQLLSDIEASTGGTDIDLSGLKPGVYLVVSRSELKTEAVRVVRQ